MSTKFMGVRVDAAEHPVEGQLQLLSQDVPLSGAVEGQAPWRLDGRLNASFKAVNLLIDRGVEVRRVHEAGGGLRRGDFMVAGGAADVLGPITDETGVRFVHIEGQPGPGVRELKRLRTAMYHRYRGGNMDEGWTRFLLEQFAFPYTSLKDDEIKAGGLASNYDVIILPHDSAAMITGEEPSSPNRGRRREYPPEYMSGIGKEGLDALKAFVEEGGRLVTLGQASELVLEKFDLDVRGALAGLSSREFFCPGSTLRVRFDNASPLAYGMPPEGLVLFWQGPVFEITPSRHNDRYSPVVTYAKKDILQSGWLIGEEHISEKAAMVAARRGQGEVVLIGFRTQHRAQTHGTFKLLFNTMLR